MNERMNESLQHRTAWFRAQTLHGTLSLCSRRQHAAAAPDALTLRYSPFTPNVTLSLFHAKQSLTTVRIGSYLTVSACVNHTSAWFIHNRCFFVF